MIIVRKTGWEKILLYCLVNFPDKSQFRLILSMLYDLKFRRIDSEYLGKLKAKIITYTSSKSTISIHHAKAGF